MQLCKSEFWDLNVTWYAEVPDFTECFQQVGLGLIPCGVFSVIVLLHLVYVSFYRPKHCLPWTPLNLSRIILCLCLVLVNVICLYYAVLDSQLADAEIYSYVLKIATFLCTTMVLIRHKLTGMKASSILFLLWLVLSICDILKMRSSFLRIFLQNSPPVPYEIFILNMISCTLVCCELFLSLFLDAKDYSIKKEQSPMEVVPLFLFLTFQFINSLVIKSRKKLLKVTDFFPLSPLLQSRCQWQRFNSKWADHSIKKIESASLDKGSRSHTSLTWTLLKAFWPCIVCSIFWELFYDFSRLVPALVLDMLIRFVESHYYVWRGYVLCFSLFVVLLMSKVALNAALYYPVVYALQTKAALASAIYKKSLQIASYERRKYTSGEMVNLMAVDLDRIFEFLLYFPLTFGAPLRILLSLSLLWQYLGPSCLAGIGMILLIIPLTLIVAKINHRVQVKQMGKKDERLKQMSEILNGIKLLKLLTWEKPFMQAITKIRDKEVDLIRTFQFCYAASSFVWACAPILVSGASFAAYVLSDEKNILYPSTAFVSLNLMNLMKFSLFEIPNLISRSIQANVSLTRIRKFLTSENYDEESIGSSPKPGNAVSIRNASLSWDVSEDPVLEDIDLHIQKGSLVAVIGLVGSGKSSLLSSLIGIMHKLSGTIDIEGNLAYVPQQPWIQNKTVRENILFMKDMNRAFYDQVIEYCSLKPDLKILPGGDSTEIGEKGVNLSGGQKQRVSLARAVYQMADVYLFDDPLSAVDSHVGKHIFENVVSNSGILKNQTRIFVTHNISFLPDVDYIVTMKDGRIEEVGTYEELIDSNGPFAEYVQKHSNEAIETSENEDQSSESKFDNPKESLLSSSMRFLSLSAHSLSNGSIKELRPDMAGVTLVEEERVEIGKVKRSLYINYLKHAGVFILLPSIFCYMFYQSFELSSNVWLSKWSSDPIVDGHSDVPLRNWRIMIYVALGFGQAFCVVCGNVLLAFGAARASKIYHYQMLESVMKSPMSFFDTTPIGRIINRFGNDMDVVDTRIPLDLDGFLSCACILLGSFVIIAVVVPVFLIPLIPICVTYYYLQEFFLTSSRQIKRLESIARSPIYSHFGESIQGVSCIKAYNVKEEFTKTLEKRVDLSTSCYFNWACCNRWLSFRAHCLGSIIVFTTSLLAVYYRDSLPGAAAGLILTYSFLCTDSLTWAVRTMVELENRSVSVERIDEYSKLPSEASWNTSGSFLLDAWPQNAVIAFKNYATRYREGLDLVLKNLDFVVSSTEKVGIVGRTGAGKSSITLALFRMIEPANGSILIDNIDISKIGLHDLRSKLTIIPQDPVVFAGSVRTNLDPNCEHDDDALWLSLERAHLKNYVSSLPEGLEHHVSEGGENFSVGQRQLLCLARALLRRTKILILDEATAAVDFETDSLIQETIRTDFKDCTVITIAHRINTILDYDRVIVMDKGEIVESGNPTELLLQPRSHFHALAEHAGIV